MTKSMFPEAAAAADIGRLLGVSGRRVRQVAAEARVAAAGRGQYPTLQTIRAFVDAARRDRADTGERAARTSVMRARAREIELRTAREEGELIPADEAVAYVQTVVGAMISRLNGLPAQVTRNLDDRRRIEAAIDGIRSEVAAIVAEHGPAYKALADAADDEDEKKAA